MRTVETISSRVARGSWFVVRRGIFRWRSPIPDPRSPRHGFTLVELLVVVSIIAILAAILFPAYLVVRKRAKLASCTNNLRQLALVLKQYEDDYRAPDVFPTWLSLLHTPQSPQYIEDPRPFICPSDDSNGAEGGRPDWIGDLPSTSYDDQFPNADFDDPGGVNNFKSSYLYEFNGEACEWIDYASLSQAEKNAYDPNGDGTVTWYEAKMAQVKGFDVVQGFGARVPVIRCFYHAKPPTLDPTDRVVNVRYDLSANVGKPKWEDDEQ